MRALNTAICAILFLAATISAKAGPRADHWSGFDFGAGNSPFPSLLGTMIGFNIEDDARISIGAGISGPWATYQLDGKVFFSPTEWSGFLGAGLDYMTGNGTFLGWTYQFNRAFIPYISGGVDFQSNVGVHVAFSVAGAVPNGKITVLPGIAIGWYF